MFTPAVRFLLVVACVAYGVLRSASSPATAILSYAVAVLLVWGHFRYGTVWLAHRAARSGNTARAAGLLGKIGQPRLLSPRSRAYYHYLKGVMAVEAKALEEARDHLMNALAGRLRTSNDRALVACQLAAVCADLGDNQGATRYLEIARSEPHRVGVRDMIEKVAQRGR